MFTRFRIDSPLGKFSVYIKHGDDDSQHNVRSDAYSVVHAVLGGRAARITDAGTQVSRVPDSAWEEDHAAQGWAWIAKGHAHDDEQIVDHDIGPR